MKMSRMTTSGVNAGSMADIAFLLLIFFLVTTTFSEDEGIRSSMPSPCPQGVDCTSEIQGKNIFTIRLNHKDELMANNELISLSELRENIKAFVDNNGDNSCAYCNGTKRKNLSDNPLKAVIALYTDRETSYKSYISVQNELVSAYYELRKELSNRKFQKSVENLTEQELKILKESYPLRISEAN
ncbi:ExbD/TolR family protein [Kordia zhangzhouensis]|uniref:ExbD/TolR family protein n=1 Tax=Kordia zhangzhouensis TaxID=1620405 RepID=UPI0007ED9164|nr:biopolymer transporter ExbD [Kordia zhangzhouensis]